MVTQIRECEGLVLRNLRYGETSRIVTLFTRELGKFGAMAKGAREAKGNFGGSLEILAHGVWVVYHRPGRDLQLLKNGMTLKEPGGLLKSPERFVLASALVEFLDRILLEDEPAPALLDLALRGLEVLEGSPIPTLTERFRAFQLRAAALLGYAAQLDRCLSCGRAVPEPAEDVAWCFRPAEGGITCPGCAAGTEGGIAILPRGLKRLRAMVHGRGDLTGVVRDAASAPPSRAWLAALDRLVEEFLRFHIDRYRGLRSLDVRLDR